ncbi:MAG: hypothetical protein GEU78_17180 [Actinobacteria bacterium]|nr:hypothetical protein [Actinomycetota bacterium]
MTVDMAVLEANIRRMAGLVGATGARLRPHIKTHKTPEIAHMQLRNGSAGLTVAKLGEAEVMADAGFDDIFIANELVGPTKLRRLVGLSRRISVRSCVDSIAGASMLSEAAVAHELMFEVLLDINTGLDRTGVAPKEARGFARSISALPGIRLVGVFSYAGYRPATPSPEERERWARREAETAVRVADELRRDGVHVSEISVAGTATAPFAATVPGVTEVRPGTYVFNDIGYARLGLCDPSQCALTIKTTVVSRPSRDRAVIDAGSKVLALDKRVVCGREPGYGFIKQWPAARIEALWEEHGVIRVTADGPGPGVGDVLDVIPNHVCPTVNLADRWYGIKAGVVDGEFTILGRGKSR